MGDKIYVKVMGRWHEAETGHALPALAGRPAVKLACTGALVARGFPEKSSRPHDACRRCDHPPSKEVLDRVHGRGSALANAKMASAAGATARQARGTKTSKAAKGAHSHGKRATKRR